MSAGQERTNSKWGAEDQIGAANLITPQTVLNASRLVKAGKTYPLGLVIDKETPLFPPRTMSLTILQPNQIATSGFGSTKSTYNDDVFMGWLGIGSHIDGLGHFGVNYVHYNGHKASEIAKVDGLRKLGLERLPPIVTRGVLLDMAGYFGVDIVKEGTPYSKEDIEGATKKQGVEIHKGDVVLFHSGWLNLMDGEKRDHKRYSCTEPGLDRSGAKYLVSKEVVAVGADTWGVETVPFEKNAGEYEVHQILIAKNGIYLLENLETRELAKDRAWEFMFVLGVTRIRGAAQMMCNPIAIC